MKNYDPDVIFFDEVQVIHYRVFDEDGNILGRKAEKIEQRQEYFKRKLEGK